MADMKKVYDNPTIINLYLKIVKHLSRRESNGYTMTDHFLFETYHEHY